MPLKQRYHWFEPSDAASYIAASHRAFAFLYSNMKTSYSGQHSFLAWEVKHSITAEDFKEFSQKLSHNQAAYDNAWFGYLGYGLKNSLEELPEDSKAHISPPSLRMTQYHHLLVFDHTHKTVELWSDHTNPPQIPTKLLEKQKETLPPTITSIQSNMTKEEYLEHVTQIKESIRNGDLYQANLTRKFYGQFNHNIEGLGLFLKLCKHSPSPYSAFLKHGDLCVLSSSPERFIHIDSKGEAEIRPIKGSAARSNDNYVDNQLKEQLKNSIKDQAENLMIVDLSRNDLSRNCDLGSVKVTKLFDITSYATVHHMSSAIKGRKSPKSSTLQLVQGCFPPGSMTGAPKIKAIELCSKIEKQERGIYSGAIGWFGGDGSTDLSVVIRTLIIEKQKFEFQVGGAIVSDSDPYKEWEETMTKAQGLIKALGLSEKTLQAL